MASISALAAAIRDRLLAEEPAPLPGFGVLRRVHVPARVENRPDGSRTLQPPRESLRLVLGQEADPGPLALVLARQLGLPVSQGRDALARHVDQLEALVSAKGEVELDGVGIVRRTDRGLLFGADPGLLATINASFQGLTSVGKAPEPNVQAAPQEEAPVTHAADASERETASDAPPPEPTPLAAPEAEAPAAPEADETETTDAPVPPPPPMSIGDTAASGDGADAGEGPEGTFISVPSEADAVPAPFSTDELAPEAPAPASLAPEAPEHDSAPEADEIPNPLAPDPADDLPLAFGEMDAPLEFEPVASEPPHSDAQPLTDFSAPLETDGPPAPEAEESPLEEFFSSPSEARESTRRGDAFGNDADRAKADAAVDDLLAGIWTAGTPQPSALGVDPSVIEDAEFDVVDGPTAAATPADEYIESAPPPAVPPPAAPVPAPPGSGDVAPPPTVDPPAPASANVGGPFEPVRLPEGLPTMPTGWTPTMGATEDEYEPDPYDDRDRAIPWLPIGLGVAAIAIALAAVLLWPRFQNQMADAPEAPATAQTTPAPSPEASGDIEEDPLALDSALAEIDPEALAAAEEQFLIGPADEAGETQASGGGVDARQERRERGELSRPSPEALAAAAAELGAQPQRETTSPPPSSGSVPAPEVSGLPSEIASSLSGSAPIRLDASGFTWVVSSTSTRSDAESAARRYRSAGFRSRVIEGVVDGRPMYRIAIGQFDTREAAYRVRDLLPADIRGRNDIWTLNLADV